MQVEPVRKALQRVLKSTKLLILCKRKQNGLTFGDHHCVFKLHREIARFARQGSAIFGFRNLLTANRKKRLNRNHHAFVQHSLM